MPLTNREVIQCALESTYRTAASAGANDTIPAFDIELNPIESLRMLDRKFPKPTFGRRKSVHSGSLLRLAFTAELKGNTAGGAFAGLDAAMQASGHSATVVASTSVTYAPVSTGIKSVTLVYFQDGLKWTLVGCRGTVVFTCNLERGVTARFEFVGHPTAGDPVDAALPSLPTDTKLGIPFIGASFDLSGFAGVINELTLDPGVQLAMSPDVNRANGFGEVRIVDRNPTGSFSPELTLVASNDWFDQFEAGTEKALTTGLLGTVAGNRITIAAPVIRYTGPSMGDRDGVRVLTMPFEALESASGDDAYSIVYT